MWELIYFKSEWKKKILKFKLLLASAFPLSWLKHITFLSLMFKYLSTSLQCYFTISVGKCISNICLILKVDFCTVFKHSVVCTSNHFKALVKMEELQKNYLHIQIMEKISFHSKASSHWMQMEFLFNFSRLDSKQCIAFKKVMNGLRLRWTCFDESCFIHNWWHKTYEIYCDLINFNLN